jgi:hypothetical protein
MEETDVLTPWIGDALLREWSGPQKIMVRLEIASSRDPLILKEQW